MPATRAERNRQKAPAKNRYNAKTYKTIAFRLRQDGSDGINADIIKQAAEAAGMSVNAWIIQTMRAAMERESAAVPRAEPVSSAGAAQECGAVSIPSEALEAVRVAAEAAGMTVDAWIVQAIKDKL